MKSYTIYDVDGNITGHIRIGSDVTDADLDLIYPRRIPGFYDANLYQIQDNIVINRELNITSDVRQYRDQLLNDLSIMNPVWYASLTAQQQAELQAYRQALLDVPQQPGFPGSVDWPQQPTWFNPAR